MERDRVKARNQIDMDGNMDGGSRALIMG